MKKEHIFNYNSETVFSVLEESLKEEVKTITSKDYDNLEGVSYQQTGTVNKLNYKIVSCNLKSGYKLEITEDDSTKYLLDIIIEALDNNKCKLTYVNDLVTTKKLKRLNYQVSLLFFKRRVSRRYDYFIKYLESKLEEK